MESREKSNEMFMNFKLAVQEVINSYLVAHSQWRYKSDRNDLDAVPMEKEEKKNVIMNSIVTM